MARRVCNLVRTRLLALGLLRSEVWRLRQHQVVTASLLHLLPEIVGAAARRRPDLSVMRPLSVAATTDSLLVNLRVQLSA